MQSFISEKDGKLVKLSLEKVEGLSYSAIMKLLRNKDVKVNGKSVNKDILIKKDDLIELYTLDIKVKTYTLVYLDKNVVVIDKKSGYTSESVYENIIKDFGEAYFIHRLDRNTSGLMIFGLSKEAETELLKGFKDRTFTKKYLAKVIGTPSKKSDILTAYLVKDKEKSLVKIYQNKVLGSVEIKTGYDVINIDQETSDLSVTLFTGKTHQIRAHLSFIGHPIVGDGKYGNGEFNRKFGAKKQMLSAYYLKLAFDKRSPLYYLDGKVFNLENK